MEIGVIIGRFQLHELHDAHKELINHVLNKHKKVVLFLGCSSVMGSKRNPLDFISRKLMIEEIYGNKMVILPLNDMADDLVWSKNIDSKIREVFPQGEVLLYGSRDSFLPYYKGQFKTIELEQKVFVSGTEIRKNVSQDIKSSSEFRAGVIYGVYKTYPTVYSTVDIAILNDSETEVLLAMKPYENKWRFVGGFVDPSDSCDEDAARREVMEEVGCEISNPIYICSQKVDDWRYRSEENKIITRLFKAKYIFGTIKPNDDIKYLKWFPIEEKIIDEIVSEHKDLFKKLMTKK